MSRLLVVYREIVGLFVDDGQLAVTVLAWLTLAFVAVPHLTGFRTWLGPTLLVGLVMILVVTTLLRVGTRR